MEVSQINALEQSKRERASRWERKKNSFDVQILNIEAAGRNLEHQIHYYNSFLAAEAAEEVKKHSWTTWLLSPLSKKRRDTEEEQEANSRKRQEMRIERDMKERALLPNNVELSNEQGRMEKAKQEFVDANRYDDHKIWKIEATLKVRQAQERQESERADWERRVRSYEH